MMACTARNAIHEADENVPLSSPLVSSCEHLLKSNGSILGSEVGKAILPKFPTLVSAIPTHRLVPSDATKDSAALKSIDRKAPISARRIHDFIVHEVGPSLHHMKIGKGHRVALVLPNGPELAVAILSIANWASCVPLNANGAHDELESDLKACNASLVIGLEDEQEGGENSIANIAYKVGIPFCGLTPSPVEAGIFQLVPPDMRAMVNQHPHHHTQGFVPFGSQEASNNIKFQPNAHEDEVLVLFTSGTTGQKKLVPHKLGDVLIATACISLSWKLTPLDVNCNLMPLFHVGGIIRQVFSPILSGGCVICCPSFDPSVFWSLLVQQQAFTWYYAAPTMHQLILETGKRKGYITKKPNSTTIPPLRMIANAAGGLLPSLARELRDVFKANVLPSYGMTECMPISSPPAAYQLEKPGTSGVAVGPELAILNKDTGKPLPFGTEGPICVRGEPCFRGYGVNHLHSDSPGCSFMAEGWFDTGDLGYMDSDGYLYITGRSKEVVNRGGEIISPLEVEEAVGSHPSVKACAAFSAPHNVLQEVVGIVIVAVPGKPKVDLHALHDFLGAGRLAAPKWPQCVVYMEALPKSHTNKLLRVKLGQRMAIPELNDNMLPVERTFSAKCPPQGTPVKVAIPCERVSVHPAQVQAKLRSAMGLSSSEELVAVRHPRRIETLVLYVYNLDRKKVISVAQEQLDCYTVPSHVCAMKHPITGDHDFPPPQPSDAISAILQEGIAKDSEDPLVGQVQELFRDLLDLDCVPAPDTNFFNLGGSSMLASQLASKVRKNFRIPFGGAEVFHNASCAAIAKVIKNRRGDPNSSQHSAASHTSAPQSQSSASSAMFPERHVNTQGAAFKSSRLEPETGFFRTLFQLIPLCVVYPVWQLSRFFLFFMSLLYALQKMPSDNNLISFLFTVLAFHFAWVVVTPLIFVVIKWVVIGTYKEGRYAVWSNYYLRWWLVDVVRKLFGKGIYGSNEELLAFYYRLLGAKIGEGARISAQADIAEFDLVTIGQYAGVEYSTLRPFGVDNGCIVLGAVTVGSHASVGVRSVVAPFTKVPDGYHMGPLTSSYEIGSVENATEHANYNRRCLPEPSFWTRLFIGTPITFFVDTVSHIPAALILYWMVSMPWHHDEPFRTAGDLMEWLCDVRRIPFYIGIRVARAIVAPLLYMATAIVVKWTIIGKFEPGPRNTTSEWQLLRYWLVGTLFSRENMSDVSELIGRHYELVSWMYRLLGAKVGKRVFWPGHLPLFTGEFDLLEIGDDVVFGSRSVIFCTTSESSEKVTLCAGANVSDNTVVLPGSTVGKNAVLGSNSVCPMGRYLPESSIWLGSRGGYPLMLERGVDMDSDGVIMSEEIKRDQLQFLGDETTIRPFGKAFYEGQADYFVFSLWTLIPVTHVSKAVIAAIHTLPLLGSLHLTAGYFYGFPASERNYDDFDYSMMELYGTLLGFFFFTHIARVFIWLGVEFGAKWGLLGRREEGRYNYDTSNYCQKWELYQILARIRNPGRMNFMDFLAGTPFMATFFRLSGCTIGKDCCLYPAGADPFMPEPDLVYMGDRCIIDCASVVCHLNTRGNFELARITLGNHVTLRTGSRIQQGVQMESGSMLLEKSLAMTGEVIEADSVWQGSPAALLFTYDFNALSPSVSFMTRNTSNTGYHEPIPLMLRHTHSV